MWRLECGFCLYSRSGETGVGGDSFLWNILEPSSRILPLDAEIHQVMRLVSSPPEAPGSQGFSLPYL